jgi:hypothetical protein
VPDLIRHDERVLLVGEVLIGREEARFLAVEVPVQRFAFRPACASTAATDVPA